jgi:hypothetical protein
MLEFTCDDSAYLNWLDSHPDGYVLNLRRQSDPDYVVLHRAKCGHISSRKLARGAYTERDYRKVCSESVHDLQAAACKEGRTDGSFSNVCGRCNPLASPN